MVLPDPLYCTTSIKINTPTAIPTVVLFSILPLQHLKYFNSLAALETKVATDSSFVIKWDSTEWYFPKWNQDQSLRTAFMYSAVWYYQELARRIGKDRMKKFIEKEKYGNMDISGHRYILVRQYIKNKPE